MDYPSGEHKWNWPIGGYPLAVVFAGKMDMGSGRTTTLTRWVTQPISGIYQRAFSNPALIGDMQMDQNPTGLLEAVAVQVEDYYIPL